MKITLRSTWREDLVRACFATLALWPVLVFVLYSVYLRIQSKYFSALLSASGLSGESGPVNQVFLYRNDLLIVGVLVPLAFLLTLGLLRHRLVLVGWCIAILLAQVLLYANLQSWGQVGRFLNWQALVNAITFGLSKPEFVGDYLALDGMLKLGALLFASGVILFAAERLSPRSLAIKFGALAGLLSMCAAAAISAYGYSSQMKRVPISGSFVANAVEALAVGDTHVAKSIEPSRLATAFEQLARAQGDDFRGPRFGVAKGMNLLLFVLETGSIEFLDTRNGLPDHPLFRRLGHQLIAFNNHFSTFPASAESNLSLLTGLYPPRALYDTCLVDVRAQNGQRPSLPGVVPALRGQGYQTGLYAPFRSQVPADKVVFELTGFERVFYGQDHDPGPEGSDPRTFKELLRDVTTWSEKGQRFAAAFFPQIGHGPWSPSLGASIRKRGERLVTEQLSWLDQVAGELQRTGQLENTVIVLTGDHGVRTALEDPRVRVGMIDQYSLHVPLIIFAPRADYSKVDAAAPTSHIDLAAELAQLFGVPRTPTMQGLAFGHAQSKERRQFMMANWYFGADGYRDAEESAMYTAMLDTAYRRGDRTVDFRARDIVRTVDETQRIRGVIENMLDLQESWIRHRACDLMTVPH